MELEGGGFRSIVKGWDMLSPYSLLTETDLADGLLPLGSPGPRLAGWSVPLNLWGLDRKGTLSEYRG